MNLACLYLITVSPCHCLLLPVTVTGIPCLILSLSVTAGRKVFLASASPLCTGSCRHTTNVSVTPHATQVSVSASAYSVQGSVTATCPGPSSLAMCLSVLPFTRHAGPVSMPCTTVGNDVIQSDGHVKCRAGACLVVEGEVFDVAADGLSRPGSHPHHLQASQVQLLCQVIHSNIGGRCHQHLNIRTKL